MAGDDAERDFAERTRDGRHRQSPRLGFERDDPATRGELGQGPGPLPAIDRREARVMVVAGFAWPREGPIDLEVADTPLQVWLKVLNTNLTGTFLCSREALRLMKEQRFGTIINVSSPQGKLGKMLRGPYSAAKFGVEGLTQVMSLENSPYNIRVNALDPGGIVATEAIRKIPGNKGKKMLSPEVVKPCAVYLASDESAGQTGRSFVATEWNKEHGIEVPYTIA